MWSRCAYEKHPAFSHYGGRGIVVCDRWKDFRNFLTDMGERPDGTSLDRIDNDRGYEPGNCRWATDIEQHNNTSANRILVVRGEALTLSQWARRTGLGVSTVRERLRRGWPPERAVFTPTKRIA